ncbi:ABC transporter permease subunit [Paenibacillus aurantius]|uniref:ABC transporter permease subunit n=1 Tax=Paenibacillus aurantius TaxID=2918900 RepID=A0AA96LBY7_9BACL|nr:ABC transporter permease subunit [Paenibacillus aurantius]WNQ10470.1 ABC transporter permease subunit [Paenibacillus aurantius]
MSKDTGQPNSIPAPKKPQGNAFTRGFGKTWPYLAAVCTLLAIWELTSLALNKPFLLPGIPAVLPRLLKVFSNPEFTKGLWSSLYSLAIGYPTACLFGALLGLLGGISRTFAVYLRSLISILQSIPPITWVPFFMILLGFGSQTIITIITIASFFPMALSVLNGTEGVNKTHLELARVLGASRKQLITRVFAPESLPALVTGAQLSFGNAWRSLIAAEMFGGASVGLGRYLSYRSEIADMQGVLISIIVIGTIAALIDLVLLERLKRRLLHWRYVSGGSGK